MRGIESDSKVKAGRNTVQRQLVLNALKNLCNHPAADEIFEYVAKTHPSISKATVYRNLAALAKSGEITTIGVFGGSMHYDHHCHKHHHFVCRTCKGIFDIENDFSDVCGRAATDSGFIIEDCTMHFSGLCRDCK